MRAEGSTRAPDSVLEGMAEKLKLVIQGLKKRVIELEAELAEAKAAIKPAKRKPASKPKTPKPVEMTTAKKRRRKSD